MTLLLDMVPGCNQLTGKAGMLDEIIEYVQSLQTQLEFLSMKLATINPRVEFNPITALSSELAQNKHFHQVTVLLPRSCLDSQTCNPLDGFVQAKVSGELWLRKLWFISLLFLHHIALEHL